MVKNRKTLINELKKNKIDYKIYYPKPLYNQYKLKKNTKHRNTEYICERIISLPFNDLSEKRLTSVFKKLQKIISKNRSIFFEKT